MNREIKFRGKCLNEGYWLYGSFVDNTRCDFDSYINDDSDNLKVVDRDTVGQFTGLHDKNGVPIYEGDILTGIKNTKLDLYVEWGKNECYFCLKTLSGFPSKKLTLNNVNKCEVTGNIYENAELLK